MSPPEPPTAITIRIKVPPGHVTSGADEFALGSALPVTTSVGQLRQQIQQAVPTHPSPERQRLLYGGRALVDNDQTLADAFNVKRDPTQTEYVIHLLVRADGTNTLPTPLPRVSGVTGRPTSPSTQTTQTNGNVQPPTVPVQTPTPQRIPPHVHAHQHHQHQHAAMLAQQQRLQAQMMQNMPRPWAGGMTFGMPPSNFGQWPGMNPNFAGVGMPGLQNRAPVGVPTGGPPAMGIPHEQIVQQPPRPGSNSPSQTAHTGSEAAFAQVEGNAPDSAGANSTRNSSSGLLPPSSMATGQQEPPQPQPEQPFSNPRPLNNQGFHVEGIGPNGQRFTIRQQMMNFPQGPFPNPTMPPGMIPMGFGPPPTMPMGVPTQGRPVPNGPSALERARQNVADMRQMLEELRNSNLPAEELQTRVSRLEERTQSLNDYIDPFNVSAMGSNTARLRHSSPSTTLPRDSNANGQPRPAIQPQVFPAPIHPTPQQRLRPSQSDVACYLLSSPSGPRAIVYSPQHGTFTGGLTHRSASSAQASRQPTPSPTVQRNIPVAAENALGPLNQAAAEQGQAAAPPAVAPDQQAQPQAAQQDPLGPAGPIVGHFWFLLRILIFIYFLLGTNLGWRRPLILFAIGFVFWTIRLGLFGDNGLLRRWWDGIVQAPPPPRARQQQQQQEGQAGAGQQPGQQFDEARGPAGNGQPGRMPTPEQFAQRLLEGEQRAQQDAQQARLHWLRERVRPIERATALFVASLWPGVGEAQVRAREEEDRRRAEEEIAERRRAEEERQRRELGNGGAPTRKDESGEAEASTQRTGERADVQETPGERLEGGEAAVQ